MQQYQGTIFQFLTLWVYSSPLWTHTIKLERFRGECDAVCCTGKGLPQFNKTTIISDKRSLTNAHLYGYACFFFSVFISSLLIWLFYQYLYSLPGRWHCQQAGTCDPPACWDTRPPGQQHGRDTLLTLCNTSCCCASLPCSAARSDGGQEKSGSPSQSWAQEKKEGIVVIFFFSFSLINQVKVTLRSLFWGGTLKQF